MQDQYQFELNMIAIIALLLFLFAIASGGFLIGALVGIMYVPANVASVLPFLAIAGLMLVFGLALTASFCWFILVAPQAPVQTPGRSFIMHSIKRSLRIDRARLG